MIKKFWHVGLTVNDLEKALEDYKFLGFEVTEKFEKQEPHALVAILSHPSGPGIEAWQWLDENHPQVKFIKNHTAFTSDDQDRDVKKLVDQGWEIVITKTTSVLVAYTFLRDPSGNYVEIADIKEQSKDGSS